MTANVKSMKMNMNFIHRNKSTTKFRTNEFRLDQSMMNLLREIYYDEPTVQFARRALQARVYCDSFRVKMSGINGVHEVTDNIQTVIDEFWMKTLHTVSDWLNMFGLCPYVWRVIPGTNDIYPKVPSWGSFFITYELTEYETNFRVYWKDDNTREEAKNVFWVIGDDAPEDGKFRSRMASLVSLYMMKKQNYSATLHGIAEAANPFMVLENHTTEKIDLEDYNKDMEAFGNKVAFTKMEGKEKLRQKVLNMRNQSMSATMFDSNHNGTGFFNANNNVGCNSLRENLNEMNNKYISRSITLDPDYVLKHGANPQLLMPMTVIWDKLSRDAASVMGFPLEFAQPQGASRSANIEGNKRFLNETVKKLRKEMIIHVKRMWILSYGQIHSNEYKKVRRRILTNPSLAKYWKLNASIELEIEWPCVPEMSKEDIRELRLDGTISSESMKQQQADLLGMPRSMITKGESLLPEERELIMKETALKAQIKLQMHQMKMAEKASIFAEKQSQFGGSEQILEKPVLKRKELPEPTQNTESKSDKDSVNSKASATKKQKIKK